MAILWLVQMLIYNRQDSVASMLNGKWMVAPLTAEKTTKKECTMSIFRRSVCKMFKIVASLVGFWILLADPKASAN